MQALTHKTGSEGFSLLELIIALAVTLVIMGMASTLVASAFRLRSRENQKSDALADVQRGLNIMSREIANAGFNLNTNGIVAEDSDSTSIRIRSNLNRFNALVSDDARRGIGLPLALPGEDEGEDVKYFRNLVVETQYLARYDEYSANVNKGTVLANRIDSLKIHYFGQAVTYDALPDATDISNPSAPEVLPSAAKYVVIALSVTLNEVGAPGSPGYQPERQVLLVSDVTLRNS
ncbi:MAG: prepilin-type N-terminal cleavage/methylation domain-containing protein, partial [Acidobacteriota bacterium]|nr:prepilin-type N-terminal cleavage/methylation domain-containing protein [Acidobacteriota bacterium]